MPSEVSLVLRRNLKTRIRKPVRRGSGICKIDVFEPQTLQASVGINKNLIINKTYITLWGGRGEFGVPQGLGCTLQGLACSSVLSRILSCSFHCAWNTNADLRGSQRALLSFLLFTWRVSFA